jgi:hypothetical protein
VERDVEQGFPEKLSAIVTICAADTDRAGHKNYESLPLLPDIPVLTSRMRKYRHEQPLIIQNPAIAPLTSR